MRSSVQRRVSIFLSTVALTTRGESLILNNSYSQTATSAFLRQSSAIFAQNGHPCLIRALEDPGLISSPDWIKGPPTEAEYVKNQALGKLTSEVRSYRHRDLQFLMAHESPLARIPWTVRTTLVLCSPRPVLCVQSLGQTGNAAHAAGICKICCSHPIFWTSLRRRRGTWIHLFRCHGRLRPWLSYGVHLMARHRVINAGWDHADADSSCGRYA